MKYALHVAKEWKDAKLARSHLDKATKAGVLQQNLVDEANQELERLLSA